MTEDGGPSLCNYFSLEQCLQTARGLNGFCQPNPLLYGQPQYGNPQPYSQEPASRRRSR